MYIVWIMCAFLTYKVSLRHLERAEKGKSEENENLSPSSEIMEEERAKDDLITYVAPKYYQGDLHFKFTLTTFLLEHNPPFSLSSELIKQLQGTYSPGLLSTMNEALRAGSEQDCTLWSRMQFL